MAGLGDVTVGVVAGAGLCRPPTLAVNIAAVMAALHISDLDRSAKQALVVVSCHADQHTRRAMVSIGRVAADMAVSYRTAWAALNRLVKAGYVAVDKSPGVVPIWTLTSAVVADPPLKSTTGTYVATTEDLCNPYRGKESLEKPKERGIGRSPSTAAVPAVDNPTPGRRSEAAFAAGSGYLPDFTGHGQPGDERPRLPDFLERFRRAANPSPAAYTADELATRARAREQHHLAQQAALTETTDAEADVIDLDTYRDDNPEEPEPDD
jgi:hypothetical protein